LNVKLGTTQLLGASNTPALVNASVATPSTLANVSINQSSGIGGGLGASSVGSGLSGLGGKLSSGLTSLTGGLTK
jgi:hypothetical protein